jgi:hypothetical protein
MRSFVPAVVLVSIQARKNIIYRGEVMSSNGESMIICKKCGTENKNGDLFCKECGDSLLEQNHDEALPLPQDYSVVVCKKCGAESNNGDSFCRGCGGSLLEVKSNENVSKENGYKKVWLTIIAVAVGVFLIAIVVKMSNNNDYTTEAASTEMEEVMPAVEEVAPAYEQVAPASISEDVFVDYDTNLMWQDDIESQTIKKNWQGAMDYCQNLSLAGFDDWRLPKIEELESIIDDTRSDSAIKLGFENVVSDYYWSSSSSVGNSNYAWDVYFGNGGGITNGKNSSSSVRCVRDSK